jgi:hypothetical protein
MASGSVTGRLVVSSFFLLCMLYERLFSRTVRVFANTGGTRNRFGIDCRHGSMAISLDSCLGMFFI